MVWFIHGTNSTNDMWTNEVSYFTSRVAWWFGDEYDTSFDWGKLNNDDDSRRAAAEKLANKIRAWHMIHPAKPIRMVAHSHGGNVCILAANILGDPRNGIPIFIDSLLTIETPVRLGDYQLQYNNVNVHNHTYNLDDFVQLNGGSDESDDLWPAWAKKKFWRNKIIKNIPKAGNGGHGEWGSAARKFPGANNIQVISSSHFGRIREIDQHSIMMQRVEEWIIQVEPQLKRW